MIRVTLMLLGCVMLPCSVDAEAASAAAQDHPRLADMHRADQTARATQPIDWDVVATRDAAHRAEVRDLLRSGQVRTANDHYHAAMVMQHGSESADYQLAFALARLAMEMDPSSKRSRWLTAAAWDRILMSKGVPQWYGTQFHSPGPGQPMALYEVNEAAVSDEERAAMHVPTLEASKEMVRQINR